MASTEPRVFIIESLGRKEEKANEFEGEVLSRTLRLSSSRAEYIYLRTAKELGEAIDEFETSRCRYLHFSCHGNQKGISLTFDHLTFAQLAETLDGALENKRVFFSSCSVMNDACARTLLPETGCLSLIGPSHDIDFDRAAVFWAAFYHLMLRDDARAMKRAQLEETTASLTTLFDVRMRYYTASKSSPMGFKKVPIKRS